MALPPGIQLPVETVWRGVAPYDPTKGIGLAARSGEKDLTYALFVKRPLLQTTIE